MVRLNGTARKPSYGRDMWRLWMLIVPLGLVTVVMAWLRDPETASRVNNLLADTQAIAPQVFNIAPEPARDPFLGIEVKDLESIQDNTYFRNAEQEAWFRFIKVLQNTPAEIVEGEHSLNVDYVQLVDQPDSYRGKLVTVYGFARQVTEQKPAGNDLGLKTYYRVVVQPTDGVDWPIIIYCLDLPPGLSEGSDLIGNMKATGLFFKNLSYRWQEGLGTAPVILAKTIEYYGPSPGMPGASEVRLPETNIASAHTTPDVFEEKQRTENSAQKQSSAFRDILGIAGWGVERIATLDNGEGFSEKQRQEALQLLRRQRSFDSADLNNWTHDGLAAYDMLTSPNDYRGQLVRVDGRVKKVKRLVPSADDATRLEISEYFEVELTPKGDGWKNPLTILTTSVPKAWLQMDELDEPASAVALYLKRLNNDDPPASLWLAKEVAWHPTTDESPFVSLGDSVLGSNGMDVGLLDRIEARGPLRADEREPFYQMLDAVGRVSPSQLIELAQQNLPSVRDEWRQVLTNAKDPLRRQLAKEVVERATDGQYSVAPLFNEPASQIGNLFLVDGTVRRAVRVEVGSSNEGSAADIQRRFGIDHYFELEIFTDDSQNYPLVFCVRELPTGFPTGGSIHVPVRIAGFFFKNWLYQTRRTAKPEDGGAQYAPLLIGRTPLLLTVEPAGGRTVQIVLGGLFIVGIAGIWAAAAWFAREDRRFRSRTPAAGFSLPPGESLDQLNVERPDMPMND